MDRESRIRRTVILLMLVGAMAGSPIHGQASPESVVMLSENTITWWVVDSSSGLAMFYGGDIVKICSDDPEGYDLLAFQEVQQPNDVATSLVAKGEAQTLAILNNLAGRYRDRGDHAKAVPLYREVLRRRQEAYPNDGVAHAYAMHGLGWSLTELGRPAEAEPILREVVRLLDPGPDRTSFVQQVARSTLGRSLTAQGRYDEAEPLLRDSYVCAAATAPKTQIIPVMRQRLVDLYDAWGRPEAAAEFRAELPAR